MKREIKFRGRSLSGEWLYGDLVNRCGDVHVFPEDGVDSIDNYEVDPDTVGQFTGLKDRKGREIYEGDILRWSEAELTSAPMEIVFKYGSFGYVYANEFHSLPGNSNFDFGKHGTDDRFEVIGNVHENSELLEGKE